MKIGIEAQRLFRPKKHGMEVVALEIIRGLQGLDKENDYHIFVKEDKDKDCVRATSNFKIDTFSSFTYVGWEQYSLPKFINKSKIDLLHCTCNTGPIFPNVPMVLTLHDIIYMETIDFSGSSYQNFGNLYRRFIVPKIINKCNEIITVSNYEKERIVNYFNINEDKVNVVYNGVDESFRVYDDISIIKEKLKFLNLPENFILFFGNTAPKKNTKRVIEAYLIYAMKVKDPLPLVVTDSSKEYIYSIMGENKVQQLSKLIYVIDYVPYEFVPLVYNMASLYLYPSLRESFGLPILEAMACGTPVITSNISSMPEVAGDAAIFVDPTNTEDIADKIEMVLSDSDLYKRKVSSGLVNISRFNWKKTAKDVFSVYQKALS